MLSTGIWKRSLLVLLCATLVVSLTPAANQDTGTVHAAKWGAGQAPKIKKLTLKNKKVNVIWSKVKKCDGYQVSYSGDKAFKSKKVVKIKGRSKTGLKISQKKFETTGTCYVKVRAYRKKGGKTYYSDWSASRSKVVYKKTMTTGYVSVGGYVLNGYGDIGGPLFEDSDQYVGKAGQYYLWAQVVYEGDVNYFVIKRGTSLTGRRTKILSVSGSYSGLDTSAVSDGKQIYYGLNGIVYKMNINGKNRKKLFAMGERTFGKIGWRV